MIKRFELAWGSVIGRDHVLIGKNNQDACGCHVGADMIVAVVCDGCSGGRHSEVGAKLGARLLVEALRRQLAPALQDERVWRVAASLAGLTPGETAERSPANLNDAGLWESARRAVLRHLGLIVKRMGGHPAQTIHDHFLFTTVGVVVTPRQTALFSLGDGLIALNGELLRLGPFPDNQPPYLGYALDGRIAGRFPKDALRFQVHHVLPTDDVRCLLIGTDGAEDLLKLGPLRPFWEDDRCFNNPDMVRRRLVQAGKEPGLLPDDTTLVVIRRKPGERPDGG